MNKFEAGIYGGIAGLFLGMGILAGSVLYSPPDIYKASVFQRQGKPNAMRIYRGGVDGIFVENPESKGTYITFSEHLKKFKDPAERKIEEGEIEKAVGWYDN